MVSVPLNIPLSLSSSSIESNVQFKLWFSEGYIPPSEAVKFTELIMGKWLIYIFPVLFVSLSVESYRYTLKLTLVKLVSKFELS